MGFELRFHPNQTTGLVATCDACGLDIEGRDGNLLWSLPDGENPVRRFEYVIACKGGCTDRADHSLGLQCSQGLDVAIGYLLNNARIDVGSVREKMAALAGLGG